MAKKIRDYDVIILGSGPAGLQAAIHAARKKVSVLVLGKSQNSSLIYAEELENLFGFPTVSGVDLLRIGREQAATFGAELLEEDVLKISSVADNFGIKTESGQEFVGRALIITTGTTREKLGVRHEQDFLGRGLSYCVECDATFFQDEDVAVVGEGSAAADGVLTMLHYAKTVHMISEKLQVADALREELEKSAAVLHEGVKVKEFVGEERIEGLLLNNGETVPVRGVFVELGAKGVMELAGSLDIALDYDMKYIEVNRKQETSVPGIYAAGDICGLPLQAAKAIGEGCVAGLEAAGYARQKAKDQEQTKKMGKAKKEAPAAKPTLELKL